MGGNGATLKDQPWMANERTMAQHARLLDQFNDERDYPFTGMWHLTNLRVISYNGGYQVRFWSGDDKFTSREYAKIVNEFLRYTTNHEADIMKENGRASISFHIPNKRDAFRLSRKYGNNSVWDWNNSEEIRTERRPRR